jgi:DNA-binding Xre family transcriptional regulator
MKVDVKKIERLLKDRNLTRPMLCRKMGRTLQWGTDLWRTRTTTFATIEKLAKILGVNAKDLLK